MPQPCSSLSPGRLVPLSAPRLALTALATSLLVLAGCGEPEQSLTSFFETAPAELQRVERAAWTDFRPVRSPTYYQWERIVFHHTGQYLPPGADCAEAVRDVLARHTQEYGLADIGFHYLICPDGTVFEGTAGGKDVVGNHFLLPLHDSGKPDAEALGLSQGSVGVAFIGQFSYAKALAVDEAGNPRLENGRPVIELNRPTREALVAATRLVAWLAREASIDVSGQVNGSSLSFTSYLSQAGARPYGANGVVPAVTSARVHFLLTGGRLLRPARCTAAEVQEHTATGSGPCKGKQVGDTKGAGYTLPPRYEELADPGEEISQQMSTIRLGALKLLGQLSAGAWDPEASIELGDTTPSTYVPAGYTLAPKGVQLRPRAEYARWREGDALPENASVGDVISSGALQVAPWQRVVLHHSALYSEGRTCQQLVEETFRLHYFGNGFADVGYHFLVCPDGTVYAGRYDGARDSRGAHAFGFNHLSAGIVLLGQMSSGSRYETILGRKGLEAPTRAALESAGRLVAWLSAELGRPLEELVPGDEVSISFGGTAFLPRVAVPFVGWHQFYAVNLRGYDNWQEDLDDYYYVTACPGDQNLDSLGYVRAVAERWRTLY